MATLGTSPLLNVQLRIQALLLGCARLERDIQQADPVWARVWTAQHVFC